MLLNEVPPSLEGIIQSDKDHTKVRKHETRFTKRPVYEAYISERPPLQKRGSKLAVTPAGSTYQAMGLPEPYIKFGCFFFNTAFASDIFSHGADFRAPRETKTLKDMNGIRRLGFKAVNPHFGGYVPLFKLFQEGNNRKRQVSERFIWWSARRFQLFKLRKSEFWQSPNVRQPTLLYAPCHSIPIH